MGSVSYETEPLEVIAGYGVHPFARIFPEVSPEEFAELVDSIRQNGQLNSATLIADPASESPPLILDGRHRLRACEVLGLDPKFEVVTLESDEALRLVFDRNITRRHLSTSQRALLAVRFERKYAGIASQRQEAAGEHGHKGAANGILGGRPRKNPLEANLPQGGFCDDGAPAQESCETTSPSEGRARGRASQSRERAAKAANVSARSVQDAKTVERKGAPAVREAVFRGDLTIAAAKELVKLEPSLQLEVLENSRGKAGKIRSFVRLAERRQVAERIASEPLPPPAGPYRVVVADPPWRYSSRKEDATHRGLLPYPDMSTESICALPVESLAHDDAVLWLWTTNAHMRDAYAVAEAWGFEPKTILTWVKNRMGLGDWLRGKTEHCLLAVRGKPVVTLTNETTVLEGPVREHSRKPDEFYALVEALCPGSKLEMFCREARDGWAVWGAETEKFQ